MLQGKVSDISRDFLRRLILAGGLGGGGGHLEEGVLILRGGVIP